MAGATKRALIVYATREGQTEKIARRIAAHLQAAGMDAQLVNARDVTGTLHSDLAEFDLLVFGASMHGGNLEKELRRFIAAEKTAIESSPRSFFLVLLSAAAPDPELRAKWLADARNKLDEQLAVRFANVEMFAGALRYSKYARPIKWMMRRIARQAGADTDPSQDYEYTDWQRVERYANQLAEVCRARSPSDSS